MSKTKRSRQPIPTRQSIVPPLKPAMMQISMGYDPSGKMEPVDIVSTKEGWSEFTFDDGSVIRAKAVILDVKKAVGQFSDDGNPIYVMQFALVNRVNAPDNLRKKG